MSNLAPKTPITVLISGSGTNLQALIDASHTKTWEITHVISNKKDAFGLTRAREAGISTSYHNIIAGGYKKRYPGDEAARRSAYDADLADLILTHSPSTRATPAMPALVVCAGWMHVLSESCLSKLAAVDVGIINLHPALPGAYNGARAIERAHVDFMDGKSAGTGVMVHYVIAAVDMGEPILVVPLPLQHPADDSIQEVERRIHEVEHDIIVRGTDIALASRSRRGGNEVVEDP